MRPLVWFRTDLRVSDNPAMHHACRMASRGVVAVFTICPKQWKDHDWAPIRVDFILRTLDALRDRLMTLNIPLRIIETDDFDGVPGELFDLARRHQCDGLFFNREYEVNERRRDQAVSEVFEREGFDIRGFTDQTMMPPGSIRTGQGGFYRMHTPFRRAWTERVEEGGLAAPLNVPKKQNPLDIASDDVPDAVTGFPAADSSDWAAGEANAKRRLTHFIKDGIDTYHEQRDIPSVDGTSSLSPYLAAGAISIRQCLHAVVQANDGQLTGKNGPGVWISELIWREFYRHVLIGFPRVSMHRPFKLETESIRWRDSDEDFGRWKRGETGYPIVDAGMRQLAQTGWMHNRLRMITAMFLTKHLLIDWRRGERHFMRHLIDGDLANNNGGWQWSASTGVDAAPYFRIFNPSSQSKRYDPNGAFIRKWIPELRGLNDTSIHEPTDHAHGMYPAAVVNHPEARERAIAAFRQST